MPTRDEIKAALKKAHPDYQEPTEQTAEPVLAQVPRAGGPITSRSFKDTLARIKREYPYLFDAPALREPASREPTIDVEDIDIPTEKELRERGETGRLPRTGTGEVDRDFWDFEPELENFERETARADGELRPFEDRPTMVGTERLAVYRQFHFYPEDHWGIQFFERPMLEFTNRLHRLAGLRGLTYSWEQILKMATYAVAKHEFTHYLVELDTLGQELRQGQRIYRPYWDNVYKTTYPGPDCLEETVASFWQWANPVIRTPAVRRKLFQDVIRSIQFEAYSRGVDLDSGRVQTEEDKLATQVQKRVRTPSNPPPVWGSLPRPYVQPWTRYENVSFTMTRSAGGRLGRVLNASRLRKTIKIYHR
jgi:hypothetical protein